MVSIAALKSNKAFQIFALLQGLDLTTTIFAFSCGLVEANPVLRQFFPMFGPFVGLFIGKAVTVAFLLLYLLTRKNPKWKFVNGCFALVVVWNITMIGLRLFHIA